MESYSLQYANSEQSPLNIIQKLSFLFEPISSYLLDRHSERFSYKTQKSLQKTLAVIKMLEIINYFIFLFNGRYRTLLERLFSIHVFGPSKPYSSNWNKTQMILNRELNWRLLSQILTLSLPLLLNSRFFNRHILSPLLGRTLNLNNMNACAICSKPCTNTTRVAGCEHNFCYICIMSELQQFGQFDCYKCSIKVSSYNDLQLEK